MSKYKDALGRDLTVKFSLGGFKGDIVCCDLYIQKITSKFILKLLRKPILFKVYYEPLPFDGLSTFSRFTDAERDKWVHEVINKYNKKHLLKQVVQNKINNLN